MPANSRTSQSSTDSETSLESTEPT
jgi:hypothetical protein